MDLSREYAEDCDRISSKDYLWERMSGQSILITGATGMVGSVLADILASKVDEYGFDVTVLSRNDKSLFNRFSNITSERFHRLSHDVNNPLSDSFDSIFHFASNTHPRMYALDPIGTISTNVLGLKNLLDSYSGEKGGRFVFASSVEIYGQNRGDVEAFDETYSGYIDCNTVRAGYNESKRVGEALCQAYGVQNGVDFIIPRLSRLYGPTVRLDDSKAISQFIFGGLSGKDVVLKSKGDQLFSYCYVFDAVDAILHLYFNGITGEAYNISGRESDVTLNELAGMIADITGVNVVHDIPDEVESKGFSKATKAILDIEKIRAIGWSPEYSLKDGLKRTINSLSSMQDI